MISEELKVYKDTYLYIREAIKVFKCFPRDFKHSVGQEYLRRLLLLPSYIVRANMDTEERRYWLGEFLVDFDFCKMVIRIAGDERYISLSQQAHLARIEGMVGRQATAWRRSAKRKSKSDHVQSTPV